MERGCTGCLDYYACPDAFTGVSKFCNAYAKHFVGLNEWVIYTVEDLSGAIVDPYHYEIHYLPEGNVVNFSFRGVDEPVDERLDERLDESDGTPYTGE